jgi:hypothetical protein
MLRVDAEAAEVQRIVGVAAIEDASVVPVVLVVATAAAPAERPPEPAVAFAVLLSLPVAVIESTPRFDAAVTAPTPR